MNESLKKVLCYLPAAVVVFVYVTLTLTTNTFSILSTMALLHVLLVGACGFLLSKGNLVGIVFGWLYGFMLISLGLHSTGFNPLPLGIVLILYYAVVAYLIRRKK